ncbi:MAG TPA: hypothetical protein ENO03_06605, partial [Candidatus Aminicenantes bacterium]|nr:hypothetical protein [Candidatus Aminicenantes bacterium]
MKKALWILSLGVFLAGLAYDISGRIKASKANAGPDRIASVSIIDAAGLEGPGVDINLGLGPRRVLEAPWARPVAFTFDPLGIGPALDNLLLSGGLPRPGPPSAFPEKP